MDNFVQRKTTLDLNGPTLSWLTEPTGVTTCGIATYIGIATASFPVGLPASYATNTGSLSYQWYYEKPVGRDGKEEGKITNGSMSGLGITGITGAATTTLTVYGTSSTYELNGTPETISSLKFFCKPDYIPSAYSSAGQVTAGTARSTGNAINENVISSDPLPSGHPPVYTVDSDKVDLIINPNIQVITQPETQTIPATNVPTSQGTARFTAVGIVTGYGSQTLSYQWQANGSDLSNGTTSYNISVPVGPKNEEIPGWGGGNAGRGNDIYLNTTAWAAPTRRQIRFHTWEESGIFHTIQIDGIRSFPENYGSHLVWVEGGRIYKCFPTSSPANLYIGGDTPAGGGNTRLVIEEGGDDWNDMLLQISGGGFFARYTTPPTIVTGTQYENRTLTDRVSGATGNILELSTATAGIQTVTCRITHPTACNSPLYTDIVNLNVITAREIIKHEHMNEGLSGSWYSGGETNLADESAQWGGVAVGSKLIALYAPEKDIVAKITMAGAAGRDNSPRSGGKGGVSSFYLTLKQNMEYVIKVGSSVSPQGDDGGGGGGTFLYEGGTLIAAVGGGGGAGQTFDGADGGGVGLSGGHAVGGAGFAGNGGDRIADGQLPLQGEFPGGSWLPHEGYERSGGRVSACTFGQYWTGQGYSACQDMGKVKFRAVDGSVITESTDSITRGYKAGLSHRVNGGQTGSPNFGGGGGGATGGTAAFGAGAGGGGGSGYDNGDPNTVTQLAGNTDQKGYVKFEV